MIQLQGLDLTIIQIEKQFKKNPNRRISSLFTQLRKKNSLSLIGDFLILGAIVQTAFRLGLHPSRQSINFALNKSEELSKYPRNVKICLLDQLFKVPSGEMKQTKKVQQYVLKTKAIQSVVTNYKR